MPLFGRRKTTEPEVTAPEVVSLPDAPPPGPGGLRSVDDHRDYLLSMVTELPPFRQQLLDVIDLSICEDVVASLSLPGFDNSAMDGYAVRAADVERAMTTTPSCSRSSARWLPVGRASHPLAPGTAMKIMTGAPCRRARTPSSRTRTPTAAQWTSTIRALSEYGQHIRRAGEDIAAGTVIYHVGDQLGPRDIGLLAAMGMDAVMVRPRPRVVIVSTGFGARRTGLSARVRPPDLRLELLPARRRLPSRRSPGLPGGPGQ